MDKTLAADSNNDEVRKQISAVLASSLPDSYKVSVTQSLTRLQKALEDTGNAIHIMGGIITKLGGSVDLSKEDLVAYRDQVLAKKAYPMINYRDNDDASATVSVSWP